MSDTQDKSAERKAKISAAQKARWADPVFRAAAVERLKAARDKAGHREKVSAVMKARWQDPAFKTKTTKRLQERRPYASKTQKAKFADPEARAQLLEKLQTARKETGANTKISQKLKNRWTDPEYRESMCLEMKCRVNSKEYQEWLILERTQKGRNFAIYPRDREEHPCALHIVLRSPDNRIFKVHNLTKFVKDNANLFHPDSLATDSKGCTRAYSNLRRLVCKKKPGQTAMGWTLVSDTEVFYNDGEDLLNRQQHEVHSI